MKQDLLSESDSTPVSVGGAYLITSTADKTKLFSDETVDIIRALKRDRQTINWE